MGHPDPVRACSPRGLEKGYSQPQAAPWVPRSQALGAAHRDGKVGSHEWQKTSSSFPNAFMKRPPGIRHVPELGDIPRWKSTEVPTVGERGRGSRVRSEGGRARHWASQPVHPPTGKGQNQRGLWGPWHSSGVAVVTGIWPRQESRGAASHLAKQQGAPLPLARCPITPLAHLTLAESWVRGSMKLISQMGEPESGEIK